MVRTFKSLAPGANVPARVPVYDVGAAPLNGTATNPRQVVVLDDKVTRYLAPPIYEVTTLFRLSLTVILKPLALPALFVPWVGHRKQES